MAIIPKFFIDAVISIGIRKNNGAVAWVGTGFFVTRTIDEAGNAIPFLVTNEHVVEGASSIVIRMKEKDSENLKTLDAPLSKIEVHSDPDIDIAVILLNGGFIQENNLEFPAFDIDRHAMCSNELRDSGVDEGSLIHMLGFPMGLVNVNSSLPICRLGCIARMSEVQVTEQKNILVDIQNFPGNSGSPIVLRPEIVSIEGTKSLNKAVLVGIIHSYIPYRESLINSQTKEVVEIRSENSGIANVHPVEYIREIIDKIQPIEQ